MTVQNLEVVSGDIKTISPIAVVDSAGAVVDISTVTGILWGAFAMVNGVIATTATLVKRLAATWQATHAYVLGNFVVPTVANNYSYECTVAGTSSGSEPTWPTTLGGTVTDGTVTWTCRNEGAKFVTDGTDGEIQLIFGEGDTAAMSGEYYHQMALVEADADEFVVMEGVLKVLSDRITS